MAEPELLATQLGEMSRARGLLLGLGLGDALGGAAEGAEGLLRAGVASQLAAFTTEGLIRAHVRGNHKGISHAPTVVWHAYCRWAFIQGVAPSRMRERWVGSERWPDGWLAGIPALGERRGNAPSTVDALIRMKEGDMAQPAGGSLGAHALTRTLPCAGLAIAASWAPAEMARDVAALTHGPEAARVAAAGTHMAVAFLRARDVPAAVSSGVATIDNERLPGVRALAAAAEAAGRRPGHVDLLRANSPNRTAAAVLSGAVYAAVSHPGAGEVEQALRLAKHAPDGVSVAGVTGALLGAVHGIDALPVALVSRLELVWVLDTLARDLVAQLTINPSGGECVDAADPGWWNRYPGW